MSRLDDLGFDRYHHARVFPTNYKPARSFQAIGRAMGISKSSVHALYARALRKIRRELRRHPDKYFSMVR